MRLGEIATHYYKIGKISRQFPNDAHRKLHRTHALRVGLDDFTELSFTLCCAAWGVLRKGLLHIVSGSLVVVEAQSRVHVDLLRCLMRRLKHRVVRVGHVGVNWLIIPKYGQSCDFLNKNVLDHSRHLMILFPIPSSE